MRFLPPFHRPRQYDTQNFRVDGQTLERLQHLAACVDTVQQQGISPTRDSSDHRPGCVPDVHGNGNRRSTFPSVGRDEPEHADPRRASLMSANSTASESSRNDPRRLRGFLKSRGREGWVFEAVALCPTGRNGILVAKTDGRGTPRQLVKLRFGEDDGDLDLIRNPQVVTCAEVLRGGGQAESVSTSNSLIAISSSNRVEIYPFDRDKSPPSIPHNGPTEDITVVSLSPNDDMLCLGTTQRTQLWDIRPSANGTEFQFSPDPITLQLGEGSRPRVIAFSDNRIAIGAVRVQTTGQRISKIYVFRRRSRRHTGPQSIRPEKCIDVTEQNDRLNQGIALLAFDSTGTHLIFSTRSSTAVPRARVINIETLVVSQPTGVGPVQSLAVLPARRALREESIRSRSDGSRSADSDDWADRETAAYEFALVSRDDGQVHLASKTGSRQLSSVRGVGDSGLKALAATSADLRGSPAIRLTSNPAAKVIVMDRTGNIQVMA